MNQILFKSHLDDYLLRLNSTFKTEQIHQIESLAKDIIHIWENGYKLFLCGNGGSAANAIHIANDFHYGIGYSVKSSGNKGLKVEALSANQAVITCLANDIGYENIFSQQIDVKASRNDLLVVLSGSGNSENIINALNVANAKSMKSYAILGFDGGKCKALASVPIHFEVNDMLISEDIQMIVFNICFQWIVKIKNR
jgi:D-sedoheptulose 7-phosphate isomerase